MYQNYSSHHPSYYGREFLWMQDQSPCTLIQSNVTFSLKRLYYFNSRNSTPLIVPNRPTRTTLVFPGISIFSLRHSPSITLLFLTSYPNVKFLEVPLRCYDRNYYISSPIFGSLHTSEIFDLFRSPVERGSRRSSLASGRLLN